MPAESLPPRPDLDHLKGQARTLQRAYLAGKADARQRVGEFHPGAPVPEAFRLADAQLVVARSYGFASWPRLRRHLEMLGRYTRTPHERGPEAGDGPDSELLRLGCLVYGGDGLVRHQQARELLAAQPELSGACLHAAAAVGDVAAAARFLASGGPGTADRRGGPFDWEPLLYLAYSRIDSPAPGHDPLAVARLLLDAGADPNAGYLWDGNYPFTALTGALGGGEDRGNQPPHSQSLALARLLLEAGADPNDSQALYNRQFDRDAGHLRLLVEFGLGRDRGGPWHQRLDSGHGTPAELLADQLIVAATENRPEWARLALAAGTDPDCRARHPFWEGRSPYELAVRRGNREVAELLLAAGAAPIPVDPVDEFLSACLAGDRALVQRLRAGDGQLAARARNRHPLAVLTAAELGRPVAVRILADQGWNVNVLFRVTPLHQAAYDGNLELVEVLLELGADPDARDPAYDATPLGWADHNHQTAVVGRLRRLADAPGETPSPGR